MDYLDRKILGFRRRRLRMYAQKIYLCFSIKSTVYAPILQNCHNLYGIEIILRLSLFLFLIFESDASSRPSACDDSSVNLKATEG